MVMLRPTGEAPRCPICGKPLSGAVVYGSQGEVWCDEGHYRGCAYSSSREMGFVRMVDSD